MVVHVESDEKFNELINDKKYKATIVDFSAVWCGPCKMIAPAYEEFSKKYTDIQFLKVDVDELEKTTAECEINSMPTFLIFKDGKKTDVILQGANITKLQQLLDSTLASVKTPGDEPLTPPASPPEVKNEPPKDRVVHIHSADQFEELIKDNKFKATIVDFSAEWCGPCNMIAPVYEDYSNKFPEIQFLKVDVDEVPSVAEDCDVNAMPTFIIFKDGQNTNVKMEGANKSGLQKLLASTLSSIQQASDSKPAPPPPPKPKSRVIHVKSDEKFAELINDKNLQVTMVDFSATWCGPCKAIAPFYDELSAKFDNIQFLKVDVDELPNVTEEARVNAMPTFIIYRELFKKTEGKKSDVIVEGGRRDLLVKILETESAALKEKALAAEQTPPVQEKSKAEPVATQEKPKAEPENIESKNTSASSETAIAKQGIVSSVLSWCSIL